MTDKTAALETLHVRLIDSRDGYADALEHVSNPSLKSTITELHQHRVRDAQALRQHLVAAGADIDEDGSLLAAAHRTFLDLKDKVTGSDDSAILAEIVRGEKQLLEAYDDAREASGAADPAYSVLTEQKAALAQAIAQIEARRDLAA